MNGLSITLCFGSYGGFYIKRWRICLGWVAFTIYGMDIEAAMEKLIRRSRLVDELAHELNRRAKPSVPGSAQGREEK